MGFRVSSAGRTLEECKRIEEDNIEFHLALLDRRFLAGDSELFNRLDNRILPTSEKAARPFLLAQLHKLTKDRLNRYGNTIFHLEPNVKDAPGGLRDYQAAAWLRQIAENKQSLNITAAEEDLASGAVDFLSAIRCFLHYANGRNDNTLTYELQAAAAERSLGVSDGEPRNAAEWMRLYFRHARTLNRLLLRYLEQKALVPQTFRQRFFNVARGSKTEPTNGRPFGVRDGMYEVMNQPALSDRSQIFSMLTEAARAGIPLSRQAERCIAYIMQHPELQVTQCRNQLEKLARNAGSGLSRASRCDRCSGWGLLTEILPEFSRIDSLVVRDFYHRYTVDEHSLRTIEHLQELADPPDERAEHFQPLWRTVDRRDLLIFALLLHDVGKGMPVENHVAGSLEALASAAERLKLSDEEIAEVRFLIERHLDMSATMQRRDIFDPATVSGFAATGRKSGTPAALVPAHLCRHSRRQSRSADAVESGHVVAAFCRDVELLQPHARSRSRSRAGRNVAARTGSRCTCRRNDGRNRTVPGGSAAAVSCSSFGERHRAAHRDVSKAEGRAGADRVAFGRSCVFVDANDRRSAIAFRDDRGCAWRAGA